jgi:AraC family transcriptional regulator
MRCKMQVKALIEAHGYTCVSIDGGEFELSNELSAEELVILLQDLSVDGFEILNEQDKHVFKAIKGVIIELVHYSDQVLPVDLDNHLNQILALPSDDLLLLFSSVKGISISQYFMLQKIERAKELIIYEGMSLIDIAKKLGFENVSEMEMDFKKASGLLPSFFENLRIRRFKIMKM